MNVKETDSENCEIDDNHNFFKVVLIGDGGTGKSSFIERLNDGGFKKDYIATIGIERHEILVGTTSGNITLVFHDTSGQEKVGPLRDEYYKGVDAAILFFDVSSRITYKNIPLWHKDVTRICSDIPIALCANKIDIGKNLRKVKLQNIKYHQNNDMGLFEISVKEKICLKEPVEYLLQNLLKNSDLKITGALGSLVFENLENLSL